MTLQHMGVEMQVKLAEFAWEASQKVGYGVNSGSAAVKIFVEHFTEALDGFVRACDTAGKEGKAQ